MAEKKQQTKVSRKTGAKKSLSRRWRILLAALSVTIIIGGLIAVFWMASQFLFSSNPHLNLKHVVVESSGWWDGKSAEVSTQLGVSPGVNLFQLNLPFLCRKLEEHPSIKKAYVARVLPDTLAVKVIERIPRAYLFDNRSKMLVDDSGMIMDRDSCVQLGNDLPTILGLERTPELKPGNVLESVLPALAMIMLCKTEFTELTPATINVMLPGKLNAIVYYKNIRRPYKVSMPNENIRFLLNTLCNCIEQARRMNDPRTSINLNYKGRAVLR